MRVSHVASPLSPRNSRKGREAAHVSFLQHVLGLRLVAHDAARDAVEALVVALHDGTERIAIAAPDQVHKLGVGVVGKVPALCRRSLHDGSPL